MGYNNLPYKENQTPPLKSPSNLPLRAQAKQGSITNTPRCLDLIFNRIIVNNYNKKEMLGLRNPYKSKAITMVQDPPSLRLHNSSYNKKLITL
jgi:hypothetical protein